MIRALITVSQMFHHGGSIHTQVVEFANDLEFQSAKANLVRQNAANSEGSVWGARYEIVRLT